MQRLERVARLEPEQIRNELRVARLVHNWFWAGKVHNLNMIGLSTDFPRRVVAVTPLNRYTMRPAQPLNTCTDTPVPYHE